VPYPDRSVPYPDRLSTEADIVSPNADENSAIVSILLILSSVAKADPFSDIWKWVEDSPEIAVPALVLGAPLAIGLRQHTTSVSC
jgi:hypothetical protein